MMWKGKLKLEGHNLTTYGLFLKTSITSIYCEYEMNNTKGYHVEITRKFISSLESIGCMQNYPKDLYIYATKSEAIKQNYELQMIKQID